MVDETATGKNTSEKTGTANTGDLATFAAGCFWGVQARFAALAGVLETTAGYTGGHLPDPGYEQVCSGTSGHAEAVQLVYDPERISYAELLNHFWTMHNPTTPNRQGPDVGSQYRSAIFCHDAEQQRLAQASREAEAASGRWRDVIVTEIVPAGPFYRAEAYHQHYLAKRGGGHCA